MSGLARAARIATVAGRRTISSSSRANTTLLTGFGRQNAFKQSGFAGRGARFNATDSKVSVVYLSPWRRFLQTVGRVTLVGIVTAGGAFWYITYRDRTPGAQAPFDENKKTIVVLGSGWGATSLLKNLDTDDYNVVVVSPKNYFLFTPLLPSVAIGTLDARSIIQPTRYITRHKKRAVHVYEAAAEDIDPVNKTVTFKDTSAIKAKQDTGTVKYDYLVYAVGTEVQTFNIPGVKEHSCFMKELGDAQKLRDEVMDCIESAAMEYEDPSSQVDVDRLLHMVVVGGGPTGVELSGELHDFVHDDLKSWYPELASKVRVTLIEAMPNILPMFSKQLINYTESTFKESKIDILTRTMVKEIKPESVVVQNEKKELVEIPFGVIVWAAGNVGRDLTRRLMGKLGDAQKNRRGLEVDDHLRLKGADGAWAIGDCTATTYAPTAQVASQQGAYLARQFEQLAKADKLQKKLTELKTSATVGKADTESLEAAEKRVEKAHKNIRPFHYSHQGSLAYIGSEKAIADLPFGAGNFASAGAATYLFWRSAYLSNLFSLRNRILVANDWLKVKFFGRDTARE